VLPNPRCILVSGDAKPSLGRDRPILPGSVGDRRQAWVVARPHSVGARTSARASRARIAQGRASSEDDGPVAWNQVVGLHQNDVALAKLHRANDLHGAVSLDELGRGVASSAA